MICDECNETERIYTESKINSGHRQCASHDNLLLLAVTQQNRAVATKERGWAVRIGTPYF